MVVVEVRRAREVHDREHRAKRLLEARDIASRGVGAQELLIAFALNLDEVRHFRDFVDVAEDLADSPLVGPRPAGAVPGGVDRFGGHVLPCAERDSPRGRSRLSSPAEAGQKCGALVPVTLSNACGPCACFGPCPGEDGKSPGRTSPCGGAVYLLDRAHIILFSRKKRGLAPPIATICDKFAACRR